MDLIVLKRKFQFYLSSIKSGQSEKTGASNQKFQFYLSSIKREGGDTG